MTIYPSALSYKQVFLLANLKETCFFQAVSYSEFKCKRANSVDPDEVAHYEPPHQDLHCLHINLFSAFEPFKSARVNG